MPSSQKSRDGNDPVPSIFTGNQNAPSSSQSHREPAASGASVASPSPREAFPPLQYPGFTSADNPTSPGSDDRVFPIRSVVSVDPTPLPRRPSEQSEGYFSTNRGDRRADIRPPTDGIDLANVPGTPAPFSRGFDLPIGIQEHIDRQSRTSGQRQDSTGPSDRIQSPSSPRGQYSAQAVAFQMFSDQGSTKSDKSVGARVQHSPSHRTTSVSSLKSAEDPPAIVTARFKHVMTDEGHAVITGRDGETLQRCEDEPIHVPGAIQSFGALVALEEQSDGKCLVRIVSENCKRVIGYGPKQLFALESFTDILSEEQADNLLDHIDFIRDPSTDVQANGPEVFTMSIKDTHKKSYKLWCAIHINHSNPNLVICEFELEDDPEFPLVATSEGTPEPPEDTLNSQPSTEELRESTEAQSRPLRVLRSARKRKGEAAAMEVFNIMSQVQEQLADAANLDHFLKVLVGVVKELTGFSRVMIYQFDQACNGKVVTELVDPRATKDLYKGLHFPASDIPKQARDLYKINKVRLLYDRDHETSRLVCRTIEDLQNPLDLTHSYLRAMSPIHIKYLANMAVRSSMSISINAFNDLWGLISCHTYGSRGTRVSFPIRKMCRLVGDSASRNIERLSYASRLQARKLINTAKTAKNPSGYIIASSDDLLKLFDADFGLLSIHEETKILGRLEATQEALALLEYLRMRKFPQIMISQDVRFDFPDLRYLPGFQVIAGLLLVPLSVDGTDFIVFFRKGQLREVKWAGNPYEKFIKEGTEGYLEPRTSFKTWTEQVIGKCREWTDEETETAAVLCLVYGKFIEVWRQKEAALQNTELTKLLLQNSAHEVRTPLNAIINYLEIALEGALDQETRDNLAKSHSASKSLIYVINDLLDLTKTEPGSKLLHEEALNLRATFREAVDAFMGDAKRKNINFAVVEDPNIPEKLFGDPRKIRQAISNITANAFEATSEGSVKANVRVAGRRDNTIDIEIIVEDTGCGMSPSTQDRLFVELEQAQAEESSALLGATVADDSESSLSAGDTASKKSKQTLGLGLAVVARIVRNMDGQLRLKSEEGKGTRFVLMIPFELETSEGAPGDKTESTASEETEIPLNQSLSADEVTLVSKSTSPQKGQEKETQRPDSAVLSRRNSANSLSSAHSKKSLTSLTSGKSYTSGRSGRSDVDRLIEAIQEPRIVHRPSSADATPMERPKVERNSASTEIGIPKRPHSVEIERKVPEHLRTAPESQSGVQSIADSFSPMKAVRMPDEASFERTQMDLASSADAAADSTIRDPQGNLNVDNMKVLVAEDDPINSRIIQKRLQKSGHEPFLTVNGEECASQYCEKPGIFDVILMDMQMPIVDGMTSTKMIRSFEKLNPSHALSPRAAYNKRVPIIAVSASLMEKDRNVYIEAGFDGWILKPIMFARLNELMQGIVDEQARKQNLYQSGSWEQGGWFFDLANQPDASRVITSPSGEAPTGAQFSEAASNS